MGGSIAEQHGVPMPRFFSYMAWPAALPACSAPV
jgi:hypothetical protein